MAQPSAALKDLVSRFQPAAAEGLEATYQLSLTGDGGDTWHMVIADQKCELSSGPAERPDVSITMSVDDWNAVIAGQLDAIAGLFSGRIEIAGDLGLASRLQALFAI